MNNQDYYNKEYVPQVNKIGKITGYLGVLLSFTPALVLAVVYGILPKPAALLTAFISGASAFGVLWFVEPDLLLSSRRSRWNLYGILIRKYL